MSDDEFAGLPDRVDTTTMHPARRYNYWLGGKDYFPVDRESAEAIDRVTPSARLGAQENRWFLQRAVRHLARQGFRQFLDIGTGLPTAENTHEIAQGIDPSSRVVYVDNDPLILLHADALLTSAPEGATAYLEADLRTPERILADPRLRETLDLTQPVALMLVAILHFIRDDEDPERIVRTLVDALPVGSCVVVSHATFEFLTPEVIARSVVLNDGRFSARSGERLAGLLTGAGLELVEPGVQSVARWWPDAAPQPRPSIEEVGVNGAVARVVP